MNTTHIPEFPTDFYVYRFSGQLLEAQDERERQIAHRNLLIASVALSNEQGKNLVVDALPTYLEVLPESIKSQYTPKSLEEWAAQVRNTARLIVAKTTTNDHQLLYLLGFGGAYYKDLGN